MEHFPGRPTGIKAPHGARVFGITWPKGREDAIPHQVLRGYCPCATCQGHSGTITFQGGYNLELREVRPVGNYALGLTWGDGHESGIYSFEYLWRLARLIDEHGAKGVEELGTLPPRAASSGAIDDSRTPTS